MIVYSEIKNQMDRHNMNELQGKYHVRLLILISYQSANCKSQLKWKQIREINNVNL